MDGNVTNLIYTHEIQNLCDHIKPSALDAIAAPTAHVRQLPATLAHPGVCDIYLAIHPKDPSVVAARSGALESREGPCGRSRAAARDTHWAGSGSRFCLRPARRSYKFFPRRVPRPGPVQSPAACSPPPKYQNTYYTSITIFYTQPYIFL
ncbi:hypothetical protein EVAR_4826_1 [Eumeta japonica]|uniref:Uncharacterized protein n=1 Tax=Eumeta variegata TaxID=151549 RepID=A0A4C1T2G5_EUMVA|nr:hypothetical protein EVAR_4826_1 [Eumeta japonica]